MRSFLTNITFFDRICVVQLIFAPYFSIRNIDMDIYHVLSKYWGYHQFRSKAGRHYSVGNARKRYHWFIAYRWRKVYLLSSSCYGNGRGVYCYFSFGGFNARSGSESEKKEALLRRLCSRACRKRKSIMRLIGQYMVKQSFCMFRQNARKP